MRQLLITFLFLYAGTVCSQPVRGDLRVLFYNVENLFDTLDDPATHDNDFLPQADRHWNSYRYHFKLKQIYKLIAAAGIYTPPEIIGLCEVENRTVVEDLFYHTPLSKYPWKIIHFESSDFRGIDVALIIRTDVVQMIKAEDIPVVLADSGRHTRSILHATLQTPYDTIDVFVNHWPSRRDGVEESQHRRMTAALTLRNRIDSSVAVRKIIIMGDFNDQPGDSSLSIGLGALTSIGQWQNRQLYNLSAMAIYKHGGTHKFSTEWSVFDQFIVSGTLLQGMGLITQPGWCHTLDFPFLLQPDTRYLGYKPFSTFTGIHYNGGFSDHLPVALDLVVKQ